MCRQVRRHGAVHARCGVARHAGGAAEAPAAVRRARSSPSMRRRDRAVPGVVKVVQVPRGVAVIAKSFWAAKQGRDALKVEWDDTRCREAQLRRHHGRVSAARRTAGAARRARKAMPRRRSASAARQSFAPATSFRISRTRRWSRSTAVVKLDGATLRDLGGRSIPNHRSDECGQGGGPRPATGEHPHLVCRRQFRPARQLLVRLHRRSGVHRQGLRRRRHADQAAVDTRG